MFFDRPETGERAVLVHLNLTSESEREDPREFEELVLSAGGDPVLQLNYISSRGFRKGLARSSLVLRILTTPLPFPA